MSSSSTTTYFLRTAAASSEKKTRFHSNSSTAAAKSQFDCTRALYTPRCALFVASYTAWNSSSSSSSSSSRSVLLHDKQQQQRTFMLVQFVVGRFHFVCTNDGEKKNADVLWLLVKHAAPTYNRAGISTAKLLLLLLTKLVRGVALLLYVGYAILLLMVFYHIYTTRVVCMASYLLTWHGWDKADAS